MDLCFLYTAYLGFVFYLLCITKISSTISICISFLFFFFHLFENGLCTCSYCGKPNAADSNGSHDRFRLLNKLLPWFVMKSPSGNTDIGNGSLYWIEIFKMKSSNFRIFMCNRFTYILCLPHWFKDRKKSSHVRVSRKENDHIICRVSNFLTWKFL